MTYTNDSTYDDEWEIVGKKDYTLMYIGYEANDPLMPPILDSVSQALYINAGMYGYEYTTLRKNDLIVYLSSSSMFSCITHGTQTSLAASDTELTVSDINALSANAFDELKFVYLGACMTGKGGSGANNLVNSMYSKGADTVLGFTDNIFVVEANFWTEAFMQILSTGCTINYAISVADCTVRGDRVCQNLPYYSTGSTYRYLVGSGYEKPCA